MVRRCIGIRRLQLLLHPLPSVSRCLGHVAGLPARVALAPVDVAMRPGGVAARARRSGVARRRRQQGTPHRRLVRRPDLQTDRHTTAQRQLCWRAGWALRGVSGPHVSPDQWAGGAGQGGAAREDGGVVPLHPLVLVAAPQPHTHVLPDGYLEGASGVDRREPEEVCGVGGAVTDALLAHQHPTAKPSLVQTQWLHCIRLR
mmetsp:Transcript_38401/g.96199  ORF Transcript_38401/g.96199 Transcript_38401/m.96199 type:complete len:201 (+) Transcript_38401:1277-1879(+)